MKRHLVWLVAGALVTASAPAWSTPVTFEITPDSPFFVESGDETGNNELMTYLNGLGYFEVYKSEVDGGAEFGSLQGSYGTVFSPADDPSGATISYEGAPAPVISDPSYLLVKDGNNDPAWYLFNISTWNGTDDLVLSGFWPGSGAISHLSLLTKGSQVPEPGTMLLLGTGLLGLGGAIRKRKQG